ncbi:hypothetical protein ACP70R_043129 [Stipagrostis hirtigluma subsp. patula]
MLLRSGRSTFEPEPFHRSGGFASRRCLHASSRLKRKLSSVEASSPRSVRRKSPPALPLRKQLPKALPPPEPMVPAQDGTDDGDDSSDEASVAALGVELFPDFPPETAARTWVRFVNNAKTCIKHYNNVQQANFVYKHASGNGFVHVLEQDGSCYYHMNFLAQDKNGCPQLFFGEIKECRVPKEEDVTCCCPVFPSDVGGKGIRTIEEAVNHVYPDWDTVGMDQEHCYACRAIFKHPKGTSYLGGHFADVRQYYAFF